MKYIEKLKDPRWQKKRLEVFEREGWHCNLCLDPNTTLHVHHKSYHGDPWETPLDELVAYCEHCHAIIEFNKKNKILINPVDALKAIINGAVRIYLIHKKNNKILIDVYHYADGEVGHCLSTNSVTIKKLHDIIYPPNPNKKVNG